MDARTGKCRGGHAGGPRALRRGRGTALRLLLLSMPHRTWEKVPAVVGIHAIHMLHEACLCLTKRPW